MSFPSKLSLAPGLTPSWLRMLAEWHVKGTPGLAEHYLEDAVVVLNHRLFGDINVLLRWLRTHLLSPCSIHLNPLEITPSDDLTFEWGRCSIEVDDGRVEEPPRVFAGLYTQTWRLEPDGLWRVASVRLEIDEIEQLLPESFGTGLIH